VATVNGFGSGTAVLLNLSPQWYNVYRGRPYAEATARRQVFMDPVRKAVTGGGRWVYIDGAGDRENGYEITYFAKDGRTILFLCYKPEITSGSLAGGNSVGLKTDTIAITLKFAKPISGVKDERAGTALPDGDTFKFTWTMNQAVVLSFATPR
jgi:hypothetical protein